MPLYRYEALDRTGNPVVGAMQVPDEQALTTRLLSMGYRPTTVQPAQTGAHAGAAPGIATGAAYRPPAAGPVSRLSADERARARMFHQLHISFRAGMPAYQAVTTVAAQVHHPALRQALSEIGLGVRDGHSLSLLMERYPLLFSGGDVGVIRAAEMGGFLPEALESVARRYEEDDNTRRRLRIWVWFFHSNMVAFFLFIPLGWWITGALPSFDVRLGFAAAGRAFMWVTLPGLLLYFGALWAFYRWRLNPRFAYRWHRLLLRMPVAGKINYLRSNAVFTRTLEYLYRAAVDPGTAWETASRAVPNLALAERFSGGKYAVESTARPSAGMMQVGLLDAADVGMVATGEATGEIAQALNYLATRYEEDTRVTLGGTVVRGAVSFTAWAFVIGALATAFFMWCYGTSVLKIVDME